MEELTSESKPVSSVIAKVIFIVLSILLFFFSLDLVVASLSGAVGFINDNLLPASLSPFVGLFLGLLITAIIESSSTTSTMVVAMVATGTLTTEEAVPVIMGANIGTTLTSTLVALSFISKKRAFRKALGVGIIHDFYNILMVMILFPLEYYYKFLSGLATYFAQFFYSDNLTNLTNGAEAGIGMGFADNVLLWINNGVVALCLSFILLFASIKLLASTIKKALIGESKNKLRKVVFDKPLKSFSWGVLLTAAIQSSSVTTSILVPLAATDRVRLKNAFTFIIGANLGTTLTALIAAGFRSEAAATIAITHLLFNVTGAIIFMSLPSLRNFLVDFVKRFSNAIMRFRLVGLAYIIIVFFLLPFLLISPSKKKEDIAEPEPQVELTVMPED